jgi:hypothetical protein
MRPGPGGLGGTGRAARPRPRGRFRGTSGPAFLYNPLILRVTGHPCNTCGQGRREIPPRGRSVPSARPGAGVPSRGRPPRQGGGGGGFRDASPRGGQGEKLLHYRASAPFFYRSPRGASRGPPRPPCAYGGAPPASPPPPFPPGRMTPGEAGGSPAADQALDALAWQAPRNVIRAALSRRPSRPGAGRRRGLPGGIPAAQSAPGIPRPPREGCLPPRPRPVAWPRSRRAAVAKPYVII